MDTRRFLLAEQYDSLGLFKIADSLDKYDSAIRTSQNTSDPSRGGLDDPSYPVQKTKTNNNQKQNTSVPKKQKNNFNENTSESFQEKSSIFSDAIMFANLGSTANEISTLSKEVLNQRAVKFLQMVQGLPPTGILKSTKSSWADQFRSATNAFLKNKHLNPEIKSLIQKISDGNRPTIAEIEAVTPKMPNAANAAQNFISKMKNLAAKNPGQAGVAKKVSQEIGKKVGAWARVARVVPVALIILNIYLNYPKYIELLNRISNNGIDGVWNDARDRAELIVLLTDAISSVTMFFPPLAVVNSALFAISIGTSTGLDAIDKYREVSGEAEEDRLNSDFIYNKKQTYFIKDRTGEKRFTKIDPKTGKNVGLYTYINQYLNTAVENDVDDTEVQYALKILLIPELFRLMREKYESGAEELKLTNIDVLNMPVLRTGVVRPIIDNGKKPKKYAPPEFLQKSSDPRFKRAYQQFYQFVTSMVPILNLAYKQWKEMG